MFCAQVKADRGVPGTLDPNPAKATFAPQKTATAAPTLKRIRKGSPSLLPEPVQASIPAPLDPKHLKEKASVTATDVVQGAMPVADAQKSKADSAPGPNPSAAAVSINASADNKTTGKQGSKPGGMLAKKPSTVVTTADSAIAMEVDTHPVAAAANAQSKKPAAVSNSAAGSESSAALSAPAAHKIGPVAVVAPGRDLPSDAATPASPVSISTDNTFMPAATAGASAATAGVKAHAAVPQSATMPHADAAQVSKQTKPAAASAPLIASQAKPAAAPAVEDKALNKAAAAAAASATGSGSQSMAADHPMTDVVMGAAVRGKDMMPVQELTLQTAGPAVDNGMMHAEAVSGADADVADADQAAVDTVMAEAADTPIAGCLPSNEVPARENLPTPHPQVPSAEPRGSDTAQTKATDLGHSSSVPAESRSAVLAHQPTAPSDVAASMKPPAGSTPVSTVLPNQPRKVAPSASDNATGVAAKSGTNVCSKATASMPQSLALRATGQKAAAVPSSVGESDHGGIFKAGSTAGTADVTAAPGKSSDGGSAKLGSTVTAEPAEVKANAPAAMASKKLTEAAQAEKHKTENGSAVKPSPLVDTKPMPQVNPFTPSEGSYWVLRRSACACSEVCSPC